MSVDLVPYSLSTVTRAERAARLRERASVVAEAGRGPDPYSVLGPSPCDGCPTAARCGALLMCCRQFVEFVEARGRWEDHRPRLPSRRRYVQVYGDAALDASLDDERSHVAATIAAAGSVHNAAIALGMRVSALYKRMHRWGLRPC